MDNAEFTNYLYHLLCRRCVHGVFLRSEESPKDILCPLHHMFRRIGREPEKRLTKDVHDQIDKLVEIIFDKDGVNDDDKCAYFRPRHPNKPYMELERLIPINIIPSEPAE